MKIIIETHNINRDFYINGFVENFKNYAFVDEILVDENGTITVKLKDWFGQDIISLDLFKKEMKTVLGSSFFGFKIV